MSGFWKRDERWTTVASNYAQRGLSITDITERPSLAIVRALASRLELGSIALLTTPLAASAQGFGGHGGGFGGHAGAPAFHGGGFRGGFAPGYRGGFGYRGGWAVGAFLPALYWDAYLTDPFDYGLAAAPYGCHWVAVDGQALLIDNATGAVVQVAPL